MVHLRVRKAIVGDRDRGVNLNRPDAVGKEVWHIYAENTQRPLRGLRQANDKMGSAPQQEIEKAKRRGAGERESGGLCRDPGLCTDGVSTNVR